MSGVSGARIAILALSLSACEWVLGIESSNPVAPAPRGGAGATGGGDSAGGSGGAAGALSGGKGGTGLGGEAGATDEPPVRGGAGGSTPNTSSGGRSSHGGTASGARGGKEGGGGPNGGAGSGALGGGASSGAAGDPGEPPGDGGQPGGTAGLGGEPHGARRSDGVDHVVYRGANGHVIELAFEEGRWWWADLHDYVKFVYPPPSATAPFSYTRGDGLNSIVFTAESGHVVEFGLLSDGWYWGDLTNLTGVPADAGPPIAYQRPNATGAVAYVSESSGELRELSLDDTGWYETNLSSWVGSPALAGPPTAFLRDDGYVSLFARTTAGSPSGVEIFGDGVEWFSTDLGESVVEASGFRRAGGGSSIVFRDTTSGSLGVRTFDAGTWSATEDLGMLAGMPEGATMPYGVERTDGVTSVVFQSGDHHVHELVLDGTAWEYAGSLTATTSCSTVMPGTSARPYVRDDGTSAVVYAGPNGEIYELRHVGASWVCNNLTLLSSLP